MMKKQILTWSAASLLALFYAACGDDVINVHNDEYAIVESLDSISCGADNEGEMALVKSTGVLYSCTNGEWSVVNASDAVDLRCKSEPLKDSTGYKIICDGKTIGTVQNGKDGDDGKDGKSGQKGSDGKAGQNGKEVNADSLTKVISKKVIDSLACRVDSSWTDTKSSLINVQISCGSGSSIIQLPTLVPNKNLTTHYKKTVMVRFVEAYSAELTVMEVDSNFDRTGKTFVSELHYSDGMELNIYQIPNMDNEKISNMGFLMADIDVTNMMNSFAQLRIKTASSGDNGRSMFRATPTEYTAFVNLDDADTIVIDWISDFKAARIKTLLEKGSSFAKANRKANDEITEFFGLGKDFPIVEHYMSDSIEMNESFAAMFVTMMDMDNYGFSVDYEKIYADYKALFAEKGNFNTALNETIYLHGEKAEYPFFFVDYFLFNKEYYYEEGDDVDEESAHAKVLQRALVDAYELPACNLKQNPIYVSRVKDGAFKYFWCNTREEVWYPLFNLDGYIESIATSIAGECVSSKKGDFVVLDSLGLQFVAECNGQFWFRSGNLGKGLCKGKKSGTYIRGAGSIGPEYFRCVDDGNGGIVANDVDSIEFAIKTPCDTSAKDSLYSVPGDSSFYRCDTKTKSFVPLFADEDRDLIVSYQLGSCNDSKDGDVNAIYIYSGQREFVICRVIEAGKGVWEKALPIEVEQGVCNADVMKKSKIYKIDEWEWNVSVTTGKAYYKCDCGYADEETADGEVTSTIRTYNNCRWTGADDYDIKLNKACNSSIINSTIAFGKEEFSCTEFYTEMQTTYRAWKMQNPDVDCPMIVAPDGGKPWVNGEPCDYRCDYLGKSYYYSQKRGGWVTLGKDETCKSVDESCQEASDAYLAINDTIHKSELLLVYESDNQKACINGLRACSKSRYDDDLNFGEWKGRYFLFMQGVSVDGFELPEIYRWSDSSFCERTYDANHVCSALVGIPEGGDVTSCEVPCEYMGNTYYYNFRKNKWQTLAEMGLTTCPSMEDYCDMNNSLNMECSAVQICSECTEECIGEDEDGECIEWGPCKECMDDDDYYSWTCNDYPFSQINPYCMDGTWLTQN